MVSDPESPRNAMIALIEMESSGDTLAGLTAEELADIDAEISFEDKQAEIERLVRAMKFNFLEEVEAWLATYDSSETSRSYRAMINLFGVWCTANQVGILNITPRDADRFAGQIPGSPATVRKVVSVASSWCSWLERSWEGFRNPFIGTKERPAKETVRSIEVPTREDVDTIVSAVDRPESVAFAFMAFRGFRVGALPSLTIRNLRFGTKSKGRVIVGDLPHDLILRLRSSGLDLVSPFSDWTGSQLQAHLRYVLAELFRKGVVQRRFTPHSFRHFFAVTHYLEHRDIEALRILLDQSTIGVTEQYLKKLLPGMGV